MVISHGDFFSETILPDENSPATPQTAEGFFLRVAGEVT